MAANCSSPSALARRGCRSAAADQPLSWAGPAPWSARSRNLTRARPNAAGSSTCGRWPQPDRTSISASGSRPVLLAQPSGRDPPGTPEQQQRLSPGALGGPERGPAPGDAQVSQQRLAAGCRTRLPTCSHGLGSEPDRRPVPLRQPTPDAVAFASPERVGGAFADHRAAGTDGLGPRLPGGTFGVTLTVGREEDGAVDVAAGRLEPPRPQRQRPCGQFECPRNLHRWLTILNKPERGLGSGASVHGRLTPAGSTFATRHGLPQTADAARCHAEDGAT
jgi:hypothetical protein